MPDCKMEILFECFSPSLSSNWLVSNSLFLKNKGFFFFWLRHYFCFVSLLDILCNTYSGLPTSSKCLSIEINATWRLVISNVDSSKLEILMADILYLLPVYDFKKNLFCFKDKPFFIYYLKEEKKKQTWFLFHIVRFLAKLFSSVRFGAGEVLFSNCSWVRY